MTDELEEMAREWVKYHLSFVLREATGFKNPNSWHKELTQKLCKTLKTLRSKTRKEDAEKIKELRSRIKRTAPSKPTPPAEPKPLQNTRINEGAVPPNKIEENSIIRLYEDEIRRLEKEKHEFFDAVVELGKQKEDLIKEIEFLKSSSLLAQEVSMKEEWRNSAVKHAQEILLLKERLSFCVRLIKEALKMGYCSTGWDKKAQAILKKEEEENER